MKLLLFGVGLILFLDDIRDFGKIDRFHHYMAGLALVYFGSR
jgi:hypothetical protein